MRGPLVRYPNAEWVPWKYTDAAGRQTYYKGLNAPVAVVLHVMQGYLSTAREWALTGHYGASWHFSVGRDGTVLQHLELADGGYHAGIPGNALAPTWALWRGHSENVNHYTIGVEHEGFAGAQYTQPQMAASRELCRWLSKTLGIFLDRDHFTHHGSIDIVNRVNDFNTPTLRDAFYAYLMEDPVPEPEPTPVDILNKAIVDRLRLIHLASDPDYLRVVRALEILRANGMNV
jgi:hypothetical protein